MLETFGNLLGFLQNENEIFKGTLKPRLFCESQSWVVAKNWDTDIAVDVDGNVMKDRQGAELTIAQAFKKSEYKALRRAGKTPYFVSLYSDYIFVFPVEGPEYCNSPADSSSATNLGVTWDNLGRPIRGTHHKILTVLCPASFDVVERKKGGDGKDINPQPRQATLGTQPPSEMGNIKDVQPRSLTFFHESIHVVGSNDETKPTTKDGEQCKDNIFSTIE